MKRLRPKVMTVSTVIAGLLPIMWSTRAGAEVHLSNAGATRRALELIGAGS